MEGEEGINSCGVTAKGVETAESYRVVQRNENPAQLSESPMPAAPVMTATPLIVAEPSLPVGMPAAPPVGMAAQPFGMIAPPVSMEGKKKRGRPKKYAPDGSVLALSPMPISASIPLTRDYSVWKQGRGRPVDSFKKKHKLEFENPDEGVAYSAVANFTPHIITVNTGEDVTMKVISFSQQGSRAICILSANGAISNVTLRQPNSSGGTLTYEGRFEILSLTGSFMPADNGGTKSRSGGMSVSLAGPDGRVLGGGISGLLIAAGPIQVVLGSFLPGHQEEVQEPNKHKFERTVIFPPTIANHNSGHFTERGYTAIPTPIRVPNNLSRENELSLSGSESKDSQIKEQYF